MDKPTEARLNELVERAISEEKDIAEGLASLQIHRSELLYTLSQKINLYDASALNDLEKKIYEALKRLNPLRLSPKNPILQILTVGLILSTIPILLLLFNILPANFHAWLSTYTFTIIGAISALTLLLILTYSYILRSRNKEQIVKLEILSELRAKDIAETILKPFLRQYINENGSQALITSYEVKSTSGLWAVMDTAYEVPTVTKDRIERMIGQLAGGSIGIAGPRGVGKSTLLLSICNPERRTFQGHQALTILTSVPVRYNPKEFILHLFSQVCERVIQRENETIPKNHTSPQIKVYDRAISGFGYLLSKYFDLIALIMTVGLGGMIFSLYWAGILIEKGHLPVFWRQLAELITPGDIFKISLVLLVVPLIYFLRLTIQSFATFINQINEILKPTRTRLPKSEYDQSLFLVREASRYLETIQYQLGMSTGWSGSVKFPEAVQFLESSANYSFAKTRNPLILPEIVNNYRNFLALVAQKYKILIGIDELDKISSSEAAQQFLNETKAIFGIRGCFYLVSVSDNALSNFERRGLAFRDEFDTSFDDVYSMETPDIESSLLLLRRRVIGLSLPFAYLCYVQSGGLPRDLIRVCREISDLAAQNSNDLYLGEAASKIIMADLRMKIRAISIAATDQRIEPETSFLLDALGRIDTENVELANWVGISNQLIDFSGTLPNRNREVVEGASPRKLIEEMAVYLLFSSTAVQYFKRLGKNFVIQPLNSKQLRMLGKLAHAKQMVTSSPQYARSLIIAFSNYYLLGTQPENFDLRNQADSDSPLNDAFE